LRRAQSRLKLIWKLGANNMKGSYRPEKKKKKTKAVKLDNAVVQETKRFSQRWS